MYEPVVVLESAPIMTPPSNSTAMIDVCGESRGGCGDAGTRETRGGEGVEHSFSIMPSFAPSFDASAVALHAVPCGCVNPEGHSTQRSRLQFSKGQGVGIEC